MTLALNIRELKRLLGPWSISPASQTATPAGMVVNDIHSRLNETRVHRVIRPDSLDAAQAVIRQAEAEGRAVSIAGGRHAMGGQQFGADTILLDSRAMDGVLTFDRGKGLIQVQAGIRWPELLGYLDRAQQGTWPQWGIRQKQTGADRLSIGGALSANAHGRGLRFKPIVDDVESFTLIDARSRLWTCSRNENSHLFRLAIGGYGLFGIIADVTLRLVPRRKVQRVVALLDLDDLISAVEQRISQGFLYGDFQFNIDPGSNEFLRRGIFSCYQPIDDTAELPERQKELREADWLHLFYLAHKNKKRAFELYSTYYLSTSGQKYWSDTHQRSEYFDDYHRRLDRRLGPSASGTEMISEIYVPMTSLVPFMQDVASDLRATGANLIYGTIRFIERDGESFLAWAKERYACVIFNLHTGHDPQALGKTAGDFRRLIERGIQYGGSYYLTYHRWATRKQVEICYPQFVEFLKLKRQFDPEERFQSEWYRSYKILFADTL